MNHVNRQVAKAILNWLNNVSAEIKVKSIANLKDGNVFVQLLHLIVSNMPDGDFKSLNLLSLTEKSVDEKFELIRAVYNKLFCLKDGELNIELAKRGDEFELAKVVHYLLFQALF